MSVGRNKDGVIYFSTYYQDHTGKRKQKKVENKEWKTLKQAKEAERLFHASIKSLDNITYQELYKLCLAFKKQQYKPRTAKSIVEINKNHILPFFADVTINKIDRVMIQEWQRSLLTKKFKGKLYSNRMLERMQTEFKSVLNYGVQYGYLQVNPFVIPKVSRIEQKKEMQVWSVDEFNQFISVVEDLKWKAVFTTLYYSGLRIGELIALNVEDYDGFNLIVNKSYDSHHHVLTTPKTNNSYRSVALNKVTRALLDELIGIYITYKIDVSKQPLFNFNSRLATTTIEERKNRYCKIAEVKQIKIHEFRHSHVSLLISLGFSPFDIANRLGHTVTMVNEVYGHLFDKSQSNIVSALNNL